jgi:hypothetical protein
MNASLTNRSIGIGFVVGALVVFALGLILAAALGASGWASTAASFFVAIFAGGGLGSMIAARLQH